MVYALSSKIHLPTFPQEVGVGFRKAADSELVNRRCAHPFLTKFDSQLNIAIVS